MKKCFVLIISLVLITACKNTTTDSTNSTDTNTQPKPTTLSERAGMYEGSIAPVKTNERKITIKINEDGTAKFDSTFPKYSNVNFTIANKTSIETNFIVDVVFSTTFEDKITIRFNSLTEISLTTPEITFNSEIYTLSR